MIMIIVQSYLLRYITVPPSASPLRDLTTSVVGAVPISLLLLLLLLKLLFLLLLLLLSLLLLLLLPSSVTANVDCCKSW
jgi:hypothetical protein